MPGSTQEEQQKPQSAAELARIEAENEAKVDAHPDAASVEAESPPENGGSSDPTERAQELARAAREARRSGADSHVVVEDASIAARDAAASGTASEEEWDLLTEWLLGDEVEVNTRLLRVRTGGDDENPTMQPWMIQAITMDVIKAAEREASGVQNRAQRRQGGNPAQNYDDLKANLRIIVEGTIKPDLKAIARSHGLGDATIMLRGKFHHLPGVPARIAGEIMDLSGFSEEDVKAAGN